MKIREQGNGMYSGIKKNRFRPEPNAEPIFLMPPFDFGSK